VPGGGGVGGREQTPVLRWFLNSLLAAAGQTLLILVTASMAAYALARPVRRRRWGEGCWSGSVGLWG
jgi:ABC-type glycerol-3-phosphate transport system permease component